MVLLLFSAGFLMIFALCRPEEAATLGREALLLSAKNVVPSLFVFSVCAKLLIAADVSGLIGRLPTKKLLRALGVSEAGLAAVAVGLFAGFPVGASMLSSFTARREMEKGEAEALMPFCNGASAAFVIGTVGASFFGSTTVGMTLFLSQTAATLLALLLTANKRRRILPANKPLSAKGVSFFSVFTSAIGECAAAMVSVTGFITFFSVFSGALAILFHGEEKVFFALLASFLEISGGLSQLSQISLPAPLTIGLAGFFLGFGGISVMMQAADKAESATLSMRCYLGGKLLSAVLCAFFSLLLHGLFP